MRSIVFLLVILPGFLFGQLTVEPIPKPSHKITKNSRTQSQDPLSLPFWDDFSFTQDFPSDSLWQDSDNVRISEDVGIAPPSINVASFDGLTATGISYSANSDSRGETDVLTSCPILLGSLGISDEVYLSFFYQFGGAGDVPEENQGDSIVLEFLAVTPDTTFWEQVWPTNSGELNRTGVFVQNIVRLDDDSYFSDEFQFRFRSFGRQSGLWDTWNVDYVYMNEGRNGSDLSFPDRNVTSKLSSPFQPYTSVPSNFFSTDLINRSMFARNNLDIINLGDPQAVSFDVVINASSYLNGSENVFPVRRIEDDLNVSSFPGVPDTVTTEESLLDSTYFQNPYDSLFIQYTLEYESGDEISSNHGGINFRINDTTQTSFILKNYYAYDDGTAEFGAGFQTSSNQLAYQFTIPEGLSDSLTGLDVHFPYIGTDPTGKALALTVWTDNNGEPGDRLYQEDATAVRTDSIDQFFHYEFNRPIILSGTFYVGYRQRFEGDLRIGLDRNTNSIDKIFTNTSGFWEKENDLQTGSLMIRPVFGTFTGVINSVDEELKETIRPYPNPTQGFFKLPVLDDIKILNLLGKEVNFDLVQNESGSLVDISNLSDGVYLLVVKKGNRSFSYRVIKQ
ncbi:MAG: T9SS type A sorting domain-containing protein [Fulvivirga sp.]